MVVGLNQALGRRHGRDRDLELAQDRNQDREARAKGEKERGSLARGRVVLLQSRNQDLAHERAPAVRERNRDRRRAVAGQTPKQRKNNDRPESTKLKRET